MTIDEAITRYKNNAEYERTHGNLQGCLEFRQLAKWLEELRAYRNMYHADNVDNCLREKAQEEGMSVDDSERYLRLMLSGMKYAVRYWEDRDKEKSDIEQTNVEAVKTALDTMRKYQMLQTDYNARLKADMVAMLTNLQWEIDEILIVTRHEVTGTVMTAQGMRKKIKENIQQKIDALKGRDNHENNN